VVNLEDTCRSAAQHGTSFVFLGHLHQAKVYRIPKGYGGTVAKIVNTGSVGFARHDPKNRATFAVFAPDEKKPVRLIRLEYAWENVADEMKQKGLPLPPTFQTS
jgi:predicted phosphodiesterase